MFLVGGTDRNSADTRTVFGANAQPVEIYLALEGEKDGLPIYCCEYPTFRIDGRQIPARLVLDPVSAGMRGAEIHWVDLRPTANAKPWRRTLIPRGDGQWLLTVNEFEGEEAPGIQGTSGTARYAAAIRPPGGPRVLESDGWTMRPGAIDPEHAPGFVVTRHQGTSVSGYARGFARLPVYAGATIAHARNRVALRPIDLVLSAYEDLARIRLDGPREEPLDGETWSWLFDVVLPHGVRRQDEGSRAIGARGRPVAWANARDRDDSQLRREDVILLDDTQVIALTDDGDGWLGNGDLVMLTVNGELAEGRFGTVPGSTFRIVRPRSFSPLRGDLREAGYGDLGQTFPYTEDVRRAVREFETDHGLPADGVPDAAMLEELAAFLVRIREPAPQDGAADGR